MNSAILALHIGSCRDVGLRRKVMECRESSGRVAALGSRFRLAIGLA